MDLSSRQYLKYNYGMLFKANSLVFFVTKTNINSKSVFGMNWIIPQSQQVHAPSKLQFHEQFE